MLRYALWCCLGPLVLVVGASAAARAAQVAVGSYVGNGLDDRTISGLAFRPDAVFVTDEVGDQRDTVMRTAAMSGDLSCELTAACTTNRVQALLDGGFQVGSDAAVNKVGRTYDYVAIRSDTCTSDFRVGSYVGNGTANRSISGLGFAPAYVLVKRSDAATNGFQRFATESGDASLPVDASSGEVTNRIQGFSADGFLVGSNTTVNVSSGAYYWAAWKPVAGASVAGTYIGDGASAHAVSGLGLAPAWVIVRDAAGQRTVHRPASIPAASDLSLYLISGTAVSDRIKALAAGGFVVGTNAEVNRSGDRYFDFALVGAPSTCATPTVTSTNTATPTTTATATATRSASGTATVSGTATAIPTSSATGTGTQTPTTTATSTSTQTASATATAPSTPTATTTGTASATATGTATTTSTDPPTPTSTATPTATSTATNTPSLTAPPAFTATPIETATDTATAAPTETPTPTSSPTDTTAATPTPSASVTTTATPSATPADTPTATAADTPISTATATVTPSEIPTDTPSAPPTATPSHTPPATSTATDSSGLTANPIVAATGTETATATPAATPAPTDTDTPASITTVTAMPTGTLTYSPTATWSSSPTDTATTTPTPSATFTDTATDTPPPTTPYTPTPTATGTDTSTSTATEAATLTGTAIYTPTVTVTASTSPAAISTITATATGTATDTVTPADTPTPTPTATVTDTPIDTATATATPSTATPTTTPAATSTPGITATATLSSTVTLTATPTPTPSSTSTIRLTRTTTTMATPTQTPTYTPTVALTTIDTLTLSCSGGTSANPDAANKLGAQYGRALRDWATHIADYGYAVGSPVEVHLGKGDNYGIPMGPYALINELVCGDACQYPPGCSDMGGHQGRCTADISRSFSHAATAKFVLNNVCNYTDWDKIWAWMRRPALTLSGNCSVSTLQGCVSNSDCTGLSPGRQTCIKPSSCNVFKDCPQGNCAANVPANQAWEAFRCYQEVFIKPQIEEWLADARTYGRCSNDATKPCSSTANCSAGGTCNGSYLTATCGAEVFNEIGNAIAQYTLPDACVDGESRCLTQGWYNCYNEWDSEAMHNNCSTSSTAGSWQLAFTGGVPQAPQCPSDPTAGGTAQVDCNTYFQWCKDATRRVLPAIYGTRQQPPGPAVWEP